MDGCMCLLSARQAVVRGSYQGRDRNRRSTPCGCTHGNIAERSYDIIISRGRSNACRIEISVMAKPEKNQRFIMKDGLAVDAETADRLGIEGDYEFEHWADPDEVAEAIFGLTPEQAKAVRESTPETK